jgi:hypothetical protein
LPERTSAALRPPQRSGSRSAVSRPTRHCGASLVGAADPGLKAAVLDAAHGDVPRPPAPYREGAEAAEPTLEVSGFGAPWLVSAAPTRRSPPGRRP